MTTLYVTAVTNDRAQLIVHTMQTTCTKVANMVANMWAEQGYKILIKKEEG